MKLKKLFSEAAPAPQPAATPAQPQPAAVSRPMVPAPSAVGMMAKPDPRTNPIGRERLPQVKATKDPKFKLLFNIEENVQKSRDLQTQARTAAQSGQLALANQLLEQSRDLLEQIVDRHVITGLRTQSFFAAQERQKEFDNQVGGSNYFVVAADLDNMKWLNEDSGLSHSGADAVLGYVGELFSKHIETLPNVKAYNQHGDEFAAFMNLAGPNRQPVPAEIRVQRLVMLINGMINMSNTLTSTGWKVESNPEPVQATLSMGLSTDYELADRLVNLGKSKGIKFFIMIDEQLLSQYQLEQRRDLFQQPLRGVMVQGAQISPVAGSQQTQPQPQVAAPQTSQAAPQQGMAESLLRKAIIMSEEKLDQNLDFVKQHQGVVFLKCNPRALPPEELEKLNKYTEKKRAYLRQPTDYSPRGFPLAEKYTGNDRTN